MSPPIYTPDGREVSEIVLPDGSTASEVIGPDGNVVFEGAPDIPDSGLLHSRWDPRELSATDGDRITTLPDLQGVNDMSAGNGADYEANGINGNPALLFDGSTDVLAVDAWDVQINQPFTIAAIAQRNGTGGGDEVVHDGADGGDSGFIAWNDGGQYRIFSGNSVAGGSADQNLHVTVSVYDSTSSEIFLDGSSLASGDAGTRGIDPGTDFHMGGRQAGGGNNAFGGVIGEILFYDGIPDTSAVYNYLDTEWS